MRMTLSFSLCFVTSEVDKSNFYKDLEKVLGWEDSYNIPKESVRWSVRAKKNRVEYIALALHSHSVL